MTSPIEHYHVDTPEQATFSYQVAGIGSRCLAALLDTLILVLVQIGLFFVVISLGGMLSLVAEDTSASIVLAIWMLLSFSIFWGYFTLLEAFWNGQTPGKRIMRLRVVREGGRPLTFVSAALRNLIRVVDFMPTLYGVGLLCMFIDTRSRRLGDLVAGTFVIRERAAITLQSLQADTLPASVAQAAVTFPAVALLTSTDYDLAVSFLQRRMSLSTSKRETLGQALANTLAARMGMPLDIARQPEAFLERVIADYRIILAQRQQAALTAMSSQQARTQ